MYDELVKELRDSAEWADRLALLMGRAEGDAHAPVMRKAADAIEELQKRVPKRPHGRLIDGDVAEVIHFTNEEADGKDFYDGILFAADFISQQPTIIEAEEE